MEQIIEFPDVLTLVEQHKLPREIYAPDGTLLFKPYDPIVESPLVANRKKWRLFANYSLTEDYEVIQINTTGQLIRIKTEPNIENMLGFIRKEKPGATVEEVISDALQISAETAGDFKDDEEFGAYVSYLYLLLAYLIHYGVLILVK